MVFQPGLAKFYNMLFNYLLIELHAALDLFTWMLKENYIGPRFQNAFSQWFVMLLSQTSLRPLQTPFYFKYHPINALDFILGIQRMKLYLQMFVFQVRVDNFMLFNFVLDMLIVKAFQRKGYFISKYYLLVYNLTGNN